MRTSILRATARGLTLGVLAATVTVAGSGSTLAQVVPTVTFGPEQHLGQRDKNPSSPFLRYRPDGHLFVVWTEDDRSPEALTQPPPPKHPPEHAWMYSSTMREALLASSPDGGRTWSPSRRVNRTMESIQGDENLPRLAFGQDHRAAVVWAIPGAKANKVRANVRFAMEDGQGGFTAPRTLSDVSDAARFPTIEAAPDGSFLIAWIDRRIDSPTPRQLYLMRLGATGQVTMASHQIGGGLCECCRLGIAVTDGGRTVYMVDRELRADMVRNHALRKSLDGGVTFAPPVELHDDGWQVGECPESGPTIGQDGRGQLHITWFTLGRSPEEAGVYYTVSKDGGASFAPRRQINKLTGPALLHTTLAVAPDGTVWFAWDNLDSASKSQIFVQSVAPDGQTWSPIQQLSHAKENALRPALAASEKSIAVSWTEIDGETSWVVLRTAAVGP